MAVTLSGLITGAILTDNPKVRTAKTIVDALTGIAALALLVLASQGILDIKQDWRYALAAIGGSSCAPLLLRIMGKYLRAPHLIIFTIGLTLLAIGILGIKDIIPNVSNTTSYALLGGGSLFVSSFILPRVVRWKAKRFLIQVYLAESSRVTPEEAASRAEEDLRKIYNRREETVEESISRDTHSFTEATEETATAVSRGTPPVEESTEYTDTDT